MTEPERLLEGAGDDLEVALLRSAKGDGPSGSCVRGTLLALGLGSGVTAVASSATAATASAATASAAGSSLPPLAATAAASAAANAPLGAAPVATAGGSGFLGSGLLSGVTVKWIGIASIAGLIGWGAITQLGGAPEAPLAAAPAAMEPTAVHAPAQDTPDVAQPAVDTPTAHAESTEAADEEPVDAVPAEKAAPVVKQRTTTKPAAPAIQPAPAAKPSLSDEVAALDQARRAMDEDPDKALQALEKYDDGFKGGVLAQEAQVLRIEALARAGKTKQAKAAAGTFLAQHPNSPLAGRVRRAVQ